MPPPTGNGYRSQPGTNDSTDAGAAAGPARPASSRLTRLKRCPKIGPCEIERRALQQRQRQGNAPESGFAVFMVQQPDCDPRAGGCAGQCGEVQRFFGNAPLASLGFAFIQGEEQETQQIDKQEAAQEDGHGAGFRPGWSRPGSELVRRVEQGARETRCQQFGRKL